MVDKYGEAFTDFKVIFKKNACILFRWDFLAFPHSWSLYVQMGFNKVLYMRSLILIGMNLLPIKCLSMRCRLFRDSFFSLKCWAQIKRWSSVKANIFYCRWWKNRDAIKKYIWQGGCISVTIVCTHLHWFTLNFCLV